MNANPYAQYRDVQAQTASPGRLLVMLYDGMVRFLGLARQGIASGDTKLTHQGLSKAQDIIDHLNATLNMDGGDVALSLASLYEYMTRRLFDANLKRDTQAIDEVIGLIQTLRSAFNEISTPQPLAGTAAPTLANLQAVSTLG